MDQEQPKQPTSFSNWVEVVRTLGLSAMGIYGIKTIAGLLQAKVIDPTIGILLLAAVLLPADVVSGLIKQRLNKP